MIDYNRVPEAAEIILGARAIKHSTARRRLSLTCYSQPALTLVTTIFASRCLLGRSVQHEFAAPYDHESEKSGANQ
jgi:hypothetical protein